MEEIMKINAYCMGCLVQRQLDNIKDIKDEDLKADYIRNVMSIIVNADKDISAPELFESINDLYEKCFGTPYDYQSLKDKYNTLMLDNEDYIWGKIMDSEDNLKEALRFSRIGNYIDFAVGDINDDKLRELIDNAGKDDVDENMYRLFINDLNNARELVYIIDNCGEIVLDKLLIKRIKNSYPKIHITALVRGMATLNDATMQDADKVGLTKLTDVIDNGTGIPGTSLSKISSRAYECIKAADLIISKGQGNFETLNGCGLNIYYLFLCKCDWFTRRFGMERYKGVFTNERHLLTPDK
jgi:uncharacterized protein with ATP-grasp and redox domains